MIDVAEYVREDGSIPYRSWFDTLDGTAAAKVAAATYRLRQGNASNLKGIGGGLAEYRIDWGPGYRLYLTQEGNTLIVLFGGGTKRGQQADISRARALLAEYRQRRAGAEEQPPEQGKRGASGRASRKKKR
jgi:putative addiction module killer protein